MLILFLGFNTVVTGDVADSSEINAASIFRVSV
jgi:hypothetical protein